MKTIFQSKAFLLGLAAIMTSIIPLINDFHGSTWKDFVGLFFGISMIIIRVYTNTTIGTPTQVAAYKAETKMIVEKSANEQS